MAATSTRIHRPRDCVAAPAIPRRHRQAWAVHLGNSDRFSTPLGLAPLKENNVLETLIVVLVVLWLLGLVSSYTLGGFIHVLLVLAIIVLLLRVFRGNKIL